MPNVKPNSCCTTGIALLLFSVQAAVLLAQEPVAMTTSYEGRLQVVSASGQTLEEQEALLKLTPGQTVRADSNAKATILYFASGKTVQLNALQQHMIQASNSKKTPPKKTRLDALKTLQQPKRVPHGSRKGLDEPPVLLTPRAGNILTTTPTFTWLSSGADSSYWIKLYGYNGPVCQIAGTLLWQSTTSDTSVTYEADLPPLHPEQKYRVEIGRPSHNKAEDSGCFVVAGIAQQAAIQKQLKTLQKQYAARDPENVTSEVIALAFLLEVRCYAEAYVTLQRALQKQPHNVALLALAAKLYEQIDLPELISALPEQP